MLALESDQLGLKSGGLYITVNIAGDLTGLKAGRYKLKVCNILDGNNDMNQKNMIS